MGVNRFDLTREEQNTLPAIDFAAFTQFAFSQLNSGDELTWASYLDLICAKLAAVAHGDCRRLVITMPPRCLKSFCVSVALPAFVLGHYPGQQIMCVSYGIDLAKTFAEDCQKLMQDEGYIDLFGQVLPRRHQPAHNLRTLKGGIRRATSIDGTATGMGCDLLIFDDPQKPGEAFSDAIRRATNEAFERTFFSRLNNPATARIVVVMQRVHEDDFVSHVLDLGGDWDIINLPVIAEEDETIAFTTLFGDHVFRRREGDALHPKRTSLEDLALMKASFGDYVWATQYQQRPAPAGGGMVKAAWLIPYQPHELPIKFDRKIQSWDTASKTEEWHDFSVCTTWGVSDKHIYLLHVFRERLNYPALRKAVIQQAQLHSATEVFIEDHSSGTQLIQELRSENFGQVRAVIHTADKQTRMINQTALMSNGFVHVPAQAVWLDDYLHELVTFPNGKHDDQVDSTSQALDMMNSFGGGWGIFEYMRQESDALKVAKEEVWTLKSPTTGTWEHIAMDGTVYRPDPDGLLRLPAEHARPLLMLYGWMKVG